MLLLENDTVTVSKEAISKYGATGAVILQLLYAEYGWRIPLDTDEWKTGILNFIQPQILSRTLTNLEAKGLITIQNNYIVFEQHKPKKKEKSILPETKKKTAASLPWAMAKALIEVFKLPEALANPNRYLRFAEKLLAEGYTPENIRDWYGDGGWWYKEYWLGRDNNSPPTQNLIVTTIESARRNIKAKPKSSTTTSGNDFFR